MRKPLPSAVLASVLITASLFSQSLTSLSGVVTDPTGSAVPGAAITVTSNETGVRRETASDEQGRYVLPQMPPGTYQLVAKKSGFSDVSIQPIRLLVNTPATVNVAFERVGAVVEIVEVTAEATQINTQDATIGNSFGTKPILRLPFEGRQVARLLSLQPGVSYIGDSDTVNGGSTQATDRGGVVNGGRSDQSNITLDGVDVNNQQDRTAFTSVLRVTLDSVQEFRVVTTNANADASRGSGAQVSMITKSGSNEVHGAAYEYVRNKIFNANTFFNNRTIADPATNKSLPTPKLNRNIFGAALGGPLKKNKLFLFGNYEQQEDRFEESVVRTVPSATLRQGTVRYVATAGNLVAVSPAELRAKLGDTIGVSQAILRMFNDTYPLPNDTSRGDLFNTSGFRFNAPISRSFKTYIARLDYNLNDSHRVFVRGQLQDDVAPGPPQFPGRAANFRDLTNSRGIAIGWDATLKNWLLSSTRYGLTREGFQTEGIRLGPVVAFRNIDDPVGTSLPFRRISPVNNLNQDFTLLKGAHTVQFGGSLRVFSNDRVSYANSFFGLAVNQSWMSQSGGILSAPFRTGSPSEVVDARFRTALQDNIANVLGLVTQVTSRYNFVPSGTNLNALPPGSPAFRKFRGEEYEMYLQDSWKATRNLNLVAGIRYIYWPAIYETSGIQTNSNIPLSEWFDLRVANASAGLSGTASNIPRISYVLGSGTGGRPLYGNLNNWSPRIALAWSPSGGDGLSKLLFGGAGRTSIRAGFGLYYDVLGAGLVRGYDATALGLSTSINNSSGRLSLADAPRFTGISDIPQALVTPPPAGQFPVVQPNVFQITNSLDDRLRAPYVMRYNLSITREVGNGWAISGAYVASGGRRTLTSEDIATPLNIRDPRSGMDYFTAATQLTDLIRANTPVAQVRPIAFWENLFPAIAGGGKSATQVAYELYNDVFPDATAGLETLDRFCDPACGALGRFAFYSPQYSYLRTIRSVGKSNYNSMQWGLRKRWASGDQVDFNWTWSHSLDLGSVTENNQSTADGLRGISINPYRRRQMYASSDFDQRHNFNANFVYALPFGKGKTFFSGMGSAANRVFGGWEIGGLFRQSSGLPISVGHSRTWPTNYNITGWATTVGSFTSGSYRNAPPPRGADVSSSGPNIFPNPAQAVNSFDFTNPGEIGNRNNVRGDGIFTIDFNVRKRIEIYKERHFLELRGEVFNLTNSVRFDVRDSNLSLQNISTFGRYIGTLGGPRVMQFALRYEF
jgi:hypothetical protein